MLVYRYFRDYNDYRKDDVVVKSLKQKMKFQGETLEEQVFRYDLPSGRYNAVNVEPNTNSMISDKYYIEPRMKPDNPWAGIDREKIHQNDDDLF